MHDPDSFLHRLASAARKRAVPASPDLPHGLATRVLAHLRDAERCLPSSAWERLALGALPVALVVMLACQWAAPSADSLPEDHDLVASFILQTQLNHDQQP